MVGISQNQQIMIITIFLIIILIVLNVSSFIERNLIKFLIEWIEHRRNNPWILYPEEDKPSYVPIVLIFKP